MKTTQKLHDIGQSLWLDNITRGLLSSGTLQRYIEELSITGLTSNPTIFDHAIKNSHDYDEAISQKMKEGKSGEALFFELAIEDRRSLSANLRPDQWCRWLGVFGGLAPAGSRHSPNSFCGQGAPRPCGTAQSIHQNSGYQRRSPCH